MTVRLKIEQSQLVTGFVRLTLNIRGCKYLIQRVLLEKGDAQNLRDFAEAPVELQFLLQDGDEHVNADGAPDLGLHRVRGGPVERIDPQVLLDPLEEQFHLPATLVTGDVGAEATCACQTATRARRSPMPRQARLDAPGALHHVMACGIARGPHLRGDVRSEASSGSSARSGGEAIRPAARVGGGNFC